MNHKKNLRRSHCKNGIAFLHCYWRRQTIISHISEELGQCAEENIWTRICQIIDPIVEHVGTVITPVSFQRNFQFVGFFRFFIEKAEISKSCF